MSTPTTVTMGMKPKNKNMKFVSGPSTRSPKNAPRNDSIMSQPKESASTSTSPNSPPYNPNDLIPGMTLTQTQFWELQGQLKFEVWNCKHGRKEEIFLDVVEVIARHAGCTFEELIAEVPKVVRTARIKLSHDPKSGYVPVIGGVPHFG